MEIASRNKANKKIGEIYLAQLRQMTSEERMKRALNYVDLPGKTAEQSIRNEFPNSHEELKKLRQRISK